MDRLVFGDRPSRGVVIDQTTPDTGTECPSGDSLQQGGECGVAGGRDDGTMEGGVVLVEELHVVTGRPHRFQMPFDLPQPRDRDPRGGEPRGDRFEQPAYLGELQQGVATQQLHRRADAAQQQLGLQTGHIRPVAPADLQHPCDNQRFHRFSHEVAGQAQLRCQLLLGRQFGTRPQLA